MVDDLLFDSRSLLIVVNLVLSWFNRSSTTAASSAELSVLVLKPGDCLMLVHVQKACDGDRTVASLGVGGCF